MNGKHLYDLCYGKKWDEVRKFLDSDSNNKDKKLEVVRYRGGNAGYTCLHMACCKHPPADIIKLLLDIGGKELVMMTSNLKNTALHKACDNEASFDAMKILIDVGGKELVVAKNYNGRTALHDLCCNINNHNNAANKIKIMLQVASTETILTDKDRYGRTPLDYATMMGASNEIKALLQPRTIKNEPAIANDDASYLVPDDQGNVATTTELQDQLQTAEQKIVDLEKNNVILSEENSKLEKDNVYWKERVDNLTETCSEQKKQLQQLKDSTRLSIANANANANAKRERDDDGDGDDDSAQSRSSKRTRVGSTANAMQSEDIGVEAVMQELLHEKQQHSKVMMQFLELGESYELQKRSWISRRM